MQCDPSGLPRSKGCFGLIDDHHFEPYFEERALNSSCKCRARVGQDDGWIMCMAPVTLKRSYGSFGARWFPPRKGFVLREALSNHPRSHRRIRQRIDDDEAPGRPILFIRIKKERAIRFELHDCDIVYFQSLRRFRLQSVDVDAMSNSRDGAAHLTDTLFDHISLP